MSGELHTIYLAELLDLYNPIADPPWDGCEAITSKDVEDALVDGRLRDQHVGAGNQNTTIRHHAERIAWLIENPDPTPITIDLQHARFGRVDYILEDGNHRTWAAIMRGDETIRANFVSDTKYVEDYFTRVRNEVDDGYSP